MTTQATEKTTEDERRLLAALALRGPVGGIVRGEAGKRMVEKMMFLGLIGDVYEVFNGAITARVTPAGKEELQLYEAPTFGEKVDKS